jgi:hypothetical protein
MIDPRIVLFATGSLLFGALIVVQLSAGAADSVAVVPTVVPRDDSQAKLPRVAPPVDSLAATILARPLFSPDRRPPEGQQSAGADLKDKRFAGIVIEPDRRLAIFAVTGAKPLAVSEGDSVDGWRIESINADEIALVSAQGSRTLRLTPAPAGGEERTQRRKIAASARPGAASKQNAAADAPQPNPKNAAAAAAKPPIRTDRGNDAQSLSSQIARTAQAPGAPQPPRASQPTVAAPASPWSMQPPPESKRNTQSSTDAGTVVRRP